MTHLAWTKGGTADIVEIADDVIEVRSTTSAPPGARLEAMTVAEPVVAVKMKSHGSRKDADGTFLIKGRLLDANRELRDRLASLLKESLMASKRKAPVVVEEAPIRELDAAVTGEDAPYERSLRPRTLDDYIGQTKHKENLRVFVEAAKRRGEPLDHLLLSGPPGLGKTTLAQILAHEMGVELHMTNGPVVEHKGALAGLLTKLAKNDILFIDEIHRLNPVVEETLYPAMEDYRIDIMTGDGAFATSIQVPVQPFTLIGATTRTGLLTAPLASRFGHAIRLDFYPPEDLAKIVERSASLLGITMKGKASFGIATRSRGTPRIANRLLRRVRDFAEVLGTGTIDEAVVASTCDRLDIDSVGFDEMDRRLLRVIIEDYEGGPVGVETLAAALGEPRDTIEDVYEPYLLQQGYLGRTPRGRVANRKAFEHLKLPFVTPPPIKQKGLFEE